MRGHSDNVLFPVGAALGGLGFLVLLAEAVRVVFADDTLSGVQSWLPWVGLGLLVVGAVLLALAVADAAKTSAPSADSVPSDG
jgi:hypothetical protein